MKRAWEIARSLMLWLLSWAHFLIAVPILIALALVFDPRKHDWLQRGFVAIKAHRRNAVFVQPA